VIAWRVDQSRPADKVVVAHELRARP
jgi:hypothetical protein